MLNIFLKNSIIIFILAILFTACATKIEKDQEELNKKNKTELIELLIKKELEINRLTLEIENYKEQNIDD
ncbi:hypothetical protein AAX26_00138 [Aliarcobacter thereius]|uniref:Lipoprotein n=2 Tax=Aliarcobacter thereius TaxID=544718 RepID=A0A1C0BA03_9BACT|nr:hypothetical protein [Aliarcobacter thereius]OCL88458.1 hypothetical protein AAX26_00138 [Aliarcobacter thereius]OCL91948.1 hypothetical protein AAX25_00673 [Aliarcobacter thereius]OCL94954.1 hypothetical protein AA347_00400 [Aliarcobacter thereius LMG 24486]OCM00402.1 hypothetical protein AAX29_00406 [Aliarcobacter thereius]QBF15173.1 hypothetical protein ATH_0075 [Aliarcobacter thereius LMG 24486]